MSNRDQNGEPTGSSIVRREKAGTRGLNFIQVIIEDDLEKETYGGRVVTRFPPEPNGYLHIGHAKSICLNFGLSEDYHGVCHLRFDDTNPETEETEYVESIQNDIRWLGFDWNDKLFFASDYFEQFFQYALQLIRDGKAYVDSLSDEEIRLYRGTVKEPGRPSPYRDRSIDENLDLFMRMRAGEFKDGQHVLRAKIDPSSSNMKMRDPLLYRIRHAHHYRTGDEWPIYPMYDYAHPLSDAIENITHSICTLEFENNRALYDWVVDNTRKPPRPHQYEFARLNLDYTVMSKRKLLQLVQEGYVGGWDDPRMPTIAGMRRRGLTPESIRNFSEMIGVAKADNRVDIGMLEYAIRDDLNHKAPRVMCVLRPLKVVITNYPEGRDEELGASYWPHDVPKEGMRKVPFSRELFIDREDFMEHPSIKFFRLSPGRDVRLRYAYIITCNEVVKDEKTGEIVELRCTYDPDTKSGSGRSQRKVKGIIHWVSAAHAVPVEVRLYDRLFSVPNPDDVEEGKTFKDYLNPKSVEILTDSLIEPSVKGVAGGTRYQFTRQGYFVADLVDSTPEAPVFNRIVTLRDTWAKISKTAEQKQRPKKSNVSRKESAPSETQKDVDSLVAELPCKKKIRYERLVNTLDLAKDHALILAEKKPLADFFEEALTVHDNPRAIANWVVNEVLREIKCRPIRSLPIRGVQLGQLVALVDNGTLSGRIAKEVFTEMMKTGGEPSEIIERKGLKQVEDLNALEPILDRLLSAYPDKVAQFKSGKTGLMGFFVGQIMKETHGQANPKVVQELFQKKME